MSWRLLLHVDHVDQMDRVSFKLRHVTGSFFAYRFVALLRNILTGIRFVKLRLFGLRTGPVARLFGTGPTGITG